MSIARRFARRVAPHGLLAAAAVLLAIAGYHLTWQILLYGEGLEDLALDRAERPVDAFRFQGVRWFRGARLVATGADGGVGVDTVTFGVMTVPVIDKAPATLEVLMAFDGPVGGGGTLRVEHTVAGETSETIVPVPARQQSRVRVPWPSQAAPSFADRHLGLTTTSFTFAADDGPDLLIGTRLHVSLWRWIIGYGAAGAALLLLWMLRGGRWRRGSTWAVLWTIALAWTLRAGAFTSNDFFPAVSGEASTFRTSYGHARKHERSGAWYPHMYKTIGALAIPAIVLTLEPAAVSIPTEYYIDTWPTPRYVWFLLELVALSTLVAAAHRHLSPGVAFLYPLLHLTFVPFLFDLYNMEDDALLILLMLPLTAVLLGAARRPMPGVKDFSLICGIMLLVPLCKITAAFLAVLVPVGLAVQHLRSNKSRDSARDGMVRCAALLALCIAAVLLGRFLNALPDTAREAQPGFAYHDHPLWDMLWAANGDFNAGTAQPFVKNGRERDRIVGAAAGLDPDDSRRMRHAAIGDDAVYRPQLRAALHERPGFFLNNALARAWREGLMYYGYPDRGSYWRLDVERGGGIVDGAEPFAGAGRIGFRGHDTFVQRARYDEIWKIAPQILIVSLFNLDQPGDRVLDMLLVVIALVGIVCMRRPSLTIVFAGAFVVKLLFNTFIHSKVRYFDFVHVPMLLGTAVLLVLLVAALARAAGGVIRSGDEP